VEVSLGILNQGSFAREPCNNRALLQKSSLAVGLFCKKSLLKEPYNKGALFQKKLFVSELFGQKDLLLWGSFAKEPYCCRAFLQKSG